MQQHRIISLLSILVMLIIPVIGWFLIAQPQLAAAATADQQRVQAAAQVTASQAIVDRLKADSAKLPELRNELDDLRGSIPAGIDPSGWIDGLSAQAKVSKVVITEIHVDDPIRYVPAVAPVDPNAPVAGGSAPTSEGDASATPTPTPTPVDFPGITTNPLIDSSNFVAVPVTVKFDGTYSALIRFINGLQSDNRLYLVTAIGSEPVADVSTGKLTGTVTGYIWAIPTGEVGNPHPVSTIVKSMDPPAPPVTETPDPTDTPDPNSTATPPPTNP
jgi:Tfp pilus assembly protein PilO